MIKSNEKSSGFKKLKIPLFLALIGAAFIIPSIPGQGNNLTIAIGLVFVLISIFVAKHSSGNDDN